MNETWLAHHGILGQKWGVRRFQNKDGSYTSAGKKRYRDPNHKFGTYDEEYQTAEKVGKSAIANYVSIDEEYSKGKLTEKQYYKKLQKQVYDPILKEGFDWISRGSGSSNELHLRFSRELSDVEVEERNGEEWFQEWYISSSNNEIEDETKLWR